MGEECGVMVGVRIRPFNGREKALSAQLCVAVDGPTTILLPPPEEEQSAKNKEPKKFTFDASFWSHDGFEEDSTGYLRPAEGSQYADQRIVFEMFGKKVLDNAWLGFHCCLFAYGQTGAGKSYSMVGYGANRGIVPISCEEIFNRIAANTDPNLSFEVTVSMVEIYNEAVQDLLVKGDKRPKKGLEIRESQQLGIYVDGVQKRAVDSYKAIEAVTDEGTTNRTVGATLMNATSSRAHTVLTIEFKQISEVNGQKGCKVSMINLVDLAGSEKAGQTGASGDRLKEGCAINKSLSALGNVIEKLADKATGKSKPGAVIPYRDSKLTRLLQNALGGSSKTVMICAISPASSNHEETLSTLRYADRAKRIKNTAVVNENPADKLIRQLREENAKLKEMVGSMTTGQLQGDSGEMADKQAEISALEEALTEMQRSFAERLAEAQEKAAKEQAAKPKATADLTWMHMANLNEDELLTNKLHFPFKEGRTRIGRPAPEGGDPPDVALAGPGIHQEQAAVTNDGVKCVLFTSEEATATTFVNGANAKPGEEGVVLAHGDRLAFGQSIFIFVDPAVGKAADLLSSGQASYAAARKELAEQGGVAGPSEEELKASRERAEELERRVREAEEAKNTARAEAEELLRRREEEFQAKMQSLREEWEQQQREEEEKRQQLEAEAEAARQTQAQEGNQAPEAQPAPSPEPVAEPVTPSAQTQAQLEQQAKAQAAQAKAVEDATAAAAQAAAHAAELARLQREFEERQRKAEESAQRRIEELDNQARKAAAEEEDHRQHEINMRKLEEQLMVVMPLVKEANLIAEELKRPYRLETKMRVDLTGARGRGSVRVTADVLRDGVRVYGWTPETLENRVFMMRDLLQRCEEEGMEAAEELSQDEDPFWDPVEVERLIGVAQVLLEGLLVQLDNQIDARILSSEGHQVGTLRVEVWPLARDGTPGVPDDEIVDSPEELLGTRMGILVGIPFAKGLPELLANDVRVEYDYFIDPEPHEVPPVLGFCRSPKFDYKRTIVQDPVTTRFIEYLRSQVLLLKVYGRDKSAAEAQAAANAAMASATASAAVAAANELAAPRHGEDAGESFPLDGQEAPDAAPGVSRPPNQGAVNAGAPPSLGEVRRRQEQVTADAETRGPEGQPPKSSACILL